MYLYKNKGAYSPKKISHLCVVNFKKKYIYMYIVSEERYSAKRSFIQEYKL